MAEKLVHAHIFTAGFDWWLVEVEPDGDTAFGYVQNGSDPWSSEWGYFNLGELDSLLVVAHGVPVCVERDLDFEPCLMRDAVAP